MIPTARFEQVSVSSEQELWDWLAANHARPEGVWLVTWKAADRARFIPMDRQLDALVAWGWTDGLRRKIDDSRSMQLISPRRQQVWAQTYRDRAARLMAEGRMQAPGQAAITAAQANGTWDKSVAVDRLELPADLAAALSPDLAARFDAMAPSYRRNVLRWLWSAKGPATRAKRIAAIVDSARTGVKIPQF